MCPLQRVLRYLFRFVETTGERQRLTKLGETQRVIREQVHRHTLLDRLLEKWQPLMYTAGQRIGQSHC